ncbi:tRNA dimethylallyltransferase, mitochondrial [Lecanora helva]
MCPRLPLIAIVGATGTGKSQLAVTIASRFNGEVINGDVLQMYEGLPITTNKTSLEERGNIPHHLLGCIPLAEETWTVKQFVSRATKIIEQIRSRNKVPILVGGTHYYTQSLLFTNTVVNECSEFMTEEEQERKWPVLGADTSVMLKELYRADPEMAERWHPNDRRKIRRSLEVCLTTGQRTSDIYKKQQEPRSENLSDGLNTDHCGIETRGCEKRGSFLRYDTLIFWTHAATAHLNARLEERVDNMIRKGLIQEVASLQTFLQDQKQEGKSLDEGKGIWIAIGAKEFVPYFQSTDRSDHLRQTSIEKTKIATKQYAKSQVRWIRLKLQRALAAAGSSNTMFLLDGSDVCQWSQSVKSKALEITSSFLSGGTLPSPATLSDAASEYLVTTEQETHGARLCDACNKTLMSEKQWADHLKSKGHKRAIRPRIDWKTLYPKSDGT